VTPAHARAGLTRQLGAVGQPPTTRDVINSYPMPVSPTAVFPYDEAGYGYTPESDVQLPGPFLGRDLPPHLYPPRNWENLDLTSYAVLGAIGDTVTILSFKVPIGRNGVVNKIANNFVGGGWVAGTGDIIWRILVDGAPPPGATSYHIILDSLGSPAQPVGIAGFRIFENQLLTVVALNNPAGANGGVIPASQRVGARLMGHLYARDMEYHDLWV
jgi:hypothetical protein